MRTGEAKELSSIGLTEPRLDLLRRAYVQERYRVRLFGVQNATLKALYEGAYIQSVQRYNDDEIRTKREMQTAWVGKATTALKNGDWKEAAYNLDEVSKLERQINEKETRLTDKAVSLIRQFAE